MRIVICGAGQVGYGIAERLAAERNDVCVIDSSPKLISILRERLDVRGVVGHGAHPEILAQAGAEQADMLIAVTQSDEVNMIACQVAHSVFKVPTKIARVRAQSYLAPHWRDLFSRDGIPIDVVISPEVEVGETVIRRLSLPGAIESISVADDQVIVFAVTCNRECRMVETPLKQLTELFPDLGAVVVGAVRGTQARVLGGNDALEPGDIAYVVARADQVKRTLAIFGHDVGEAKRVVIVGAGNIGFYVAKGLEARGSKVRLKMIESSAARAEEVAQALSHTVVLNGSALDQSLLLEAEVGQADTVVTLTNDDQANILAGVMAKQLGCKRSLALINSTTYPDFTAALGIDAYIAPRAVTVSRILRHVRRGRIRSVHALQNGAAEVIEADALETSPLVGRPLREVDLPAGVRIGAIYRNRSVILPRGDTTIQPRDRIVLFAEKERVRQVEHMFRVSLEFF